MILALDLGSSRFKAALFDSSSSGGATRARAEAPITCRRGDGGLTEIDPAVAVAAVREVVGQCLDGNNRDLLRAVALTSQAQTLTVLAPDGRTLVPFVSWQDGRALRACAALAALPSLAVFAGRSSFGCLLPALAICHLRRIRDELSAVLARANRVALLPAYLADRWSGRLVVDENLAAMSGLYDLGERRWWSEALDAVGLVAGQLPEVVPVGCAAAHTTGSAAVDGLPAGIPIVLSGNDQTAGAFGARVEEDGSVLVTLGTAHAAYRWRATLPDPAAGLVRGPYPGGGYYAMAASSHGGDIVAWARTVVAGCRDPGDFERAAAGAPLGCRGVTFDFTSSDAGWAWRNLSAVHQVGDMTRAVLESLAAQAEALVRAIAPAGLPSVKVAGGGASSSVLCTALAARLGVPVKRTAGDPLTGAARMAAGAVGRGEVRA